MISLLSNYSPLGGVGEFLLVFESAVKGPRGLEKGIEMFACRKRYLSAAFTQTRHPPFQPGSPCPSPSGTSQVRPCLLLLKWRPNEFFIAPDKLQQKGNWLQDRRVAMCTCRLRLYSPSQGSVEKKVHYLSFSFPVFLPLGSVGNVAEFGI